MAAGELVPVGSLSDHDLTRYLREQKLDVVVDLMGYTDLHRARVLAARVAPVQVSWLGYPGTLGGSLTDYLVADEYTVPRGLEQHYSERLVRLPGCLLPGDHSRVIGAPLSRSDYGLRADSVVLCSFNQTRKMNPLVFDVWMSALREVPGTVLWLSEERAEATGNLRQAAQRRNIDPERLVFAARVPALADHLARYQVADLALDTFPYGSHSTALDALWAGCPLIAWAGRGFASRVSGSVLQAAGAPELIANSADEYLRLIVSLARESERRTSIRARLIGNRHRCALFDAQRFTRSLEKAYAEMVHRSALGLTPEPLWIT
jgi:predicted O-linked N-acetylglucosamine transferase (SPINDLY family)